MTIMNDYELDEPIGYGSFSTVYRAHNRKTGEIFAIKLVKIEEQEDESEANKDTFMAYNLKRIHKEINLWKPFNHVNLCRLIDVIIDEEKGTVAFIMEYANNGDLLNILSEKSLHIGEVLNYFRQLCEGVKYLHENGIVHGDIKMENILLNNEKVKLSDFGLAKKASCYDFKDNCGTVEYAAPELLIGDPEIEKVDPFKADIWALGVTLYALLHHQFPFDGPSPKILKVRILTTEPIYHPCKADDEKYTKLQELIKKLLEKNWKRRPSIEEILKEL